MSLKEKIDVRQLEPGHVFLASFLAGLNQIGMLNQASVNIAARRAGSYLAEYVKAVSRGNVLHDTLEENPAAALNRLDEMLGLATEMKVFTDGNITTCKITSSTCKFCPKGVGEAELEGTICPYPGLFEEYLNGVLPEGETLKLVVTNRKSLIKQDQSCIIEFKSDQKTNAFSISF